MTDYPVARFDAVAIHADAYEGYPAVQASIIEAGDTGGITASSSEQMGVYHSRLGSIAVEQAKQNDPVPKIFCFL